MRDKIQLGIACGSNCEHYVNFLVESIRKTVGTQSIKLIFGINRDCVNVDFLIDSNKDFEIDVVYSIENADVIPSSECHGRTLDVILDNINAEYGMFVDCDCAFLEKNWDGKMLSCIKDNIVIIGSEYDGQKYMGFPNIVCCLFKTKVLKDLQVSLYPKGTIIIDNNNDYIYNRDVGDSIRLDVGWELCYKLKTSGYNGIAMPLYRSKHMEAKFMHGEMRGEEHQLNGIPIVTHVGRSSSRCFMKDSVIIEWKTQVNRWLKDND